MIKIEYWNSYDILGVQYENTGFRNRFWLDVDVKKPEYVIEREADENSSGDLVNTFLKWTKQYQFDIFCLEPLADALTTIFMHDQVWVTLDNGYSGKVKDFVANAVWTEIDNLCKVSVTFTTNSYKINGHNAAGCSTP